MTHSINRLLAFSFALSVGTTAAQAASVSGMGTWETTLHARDLDGDHSTIEAYYDSVLDITWLQNYHYGRTTAYEDLMTWDDAMAWAQNLDINGITGWRLPRVNDTGAPGCDYGFQGTDCGYNLDPSTGELAHLYYVTLGMVGFHDTNGEWVDYRISNDGPFYISESDRPTDSSNNTSFWSSTEYAPDTNSAWWFIFSDGEQAGKWSTYADDPVTKATRMHAWAVHDGDVGYAVSAVPVPAAAWLLASGLVGLVGLGRGRRAG